jgi:hypothetical protein
VNIKLVTVINIKDKTRYTNTTCEINVILLKALRNSSGIKRIMKKE